MFDLQEGSFELLLVNAHHIEAIPGRKTKVKDWEWIANPLVVYAHVLPDMQREATADMEAALRE
ncbi:MAG: hypothetical protein ACM3US_00100 [Sphingomonadaceae bacterium]